MTAPQIDTGKGRATIRLLGRLLGEVIRELQGPAAFDLVETMRRQSVGDFRAGAGEIAGELAALSQPDMLLLIRAFSIFSQLANIADDHALRRETRALGSGAAQRMEHHAGLSARRVRAYLKDATFVPVVTAHPTEVRRKSVLDREEEIGSLLQRRDQASAQTAEQAEIDAQLKRAIRILWQTRMLRDSRIAVIDEIENNLAIFARTFLTQLPLVKRRLARLFGLEGELMPYLRLGPGWAATATAIPMCRPRPCPMPWGGSRRSCWIITWPRFTPWARNCRCPTRWSPPATR